MLLTNDLTVGVLNEAIEKNADFIVSYHPPLFSATKRWTCADTKHEIAVRALEQRIGVYSHHTALDAKNGGVNDWLCSFLSDTEVKSKRPIQRRLADERLKIVCFVQEKNVEQVRTAMAAKGAGVIGNYDNCAFQSNGVGTFKGNDASNATVGQANRQEFVDEIKLEMLCDKRQLSSVLAAMIDAHDYEEPAFDVFPLVAQEIADTGIGRVVELHSAVPLCDIVERIKKHLGLKHLRVSSNAELAEKKIQTIALCAGSGYSVLKSLTNVDLWLTGEMSHHDALEANERGVAVVLCEHSNTERGYLQQMRKELTELFASENEHIDVMVSAVDRDPLQCV